MKKTSVLLLLIYCFANSAFAQGDGPRAMTMAPKGLNLITPAYLDLSSNFNFAQDVFIEGGDIKSKVVPITYIRYFGIGGKFAQIWVTPIWGNVSGQIEQSGLTVTVPTTSGIADPYVAMRLGLIGAPTLSIDEFKEHKQSFQLYMLVGASIPLGKYNQSHPVNLGTNRWAMRLATPMVLPFGNNAERQFFLEVTPSLMLYTKNNQPFGGTSRTQSPLFILESHLSRNLTKSFWVSADLRYQYGGETTTDEQIDDNKIDQLGLTATAGYNIFKPLGISLSYGEIVASKEGKGKMLRVRLTMLF
jgi:hypothetical protein